MEGQMQEVRKSVEGWWSSMTWSHDPERKKTKNGKHGLDRLY